MVFVSLYQNGITGVARRLVCMAETPRQRQNKKNELWVKWYAVPENKAAHNKAARRRSNKRRDELKVFIKSCLEDSGCVRCGFAESAALQYHHRDPKTKLFNIGDGWNRQSLKAIMIEASKCDIICANCHAILHHEERKAA